MRGRQGPVLACRFSRLDLDVRHRVANENAPKWSISAAGRHREGLRSAPHGPRQGRSQMALLQVSLRVSMIRSSFLNGVRPERRPAYL